MKTNFIIAVKGLAGCRLLYLILWLPHRKHPCPLFPKIVNKFRFGCSMSVRFTYDVCTACSF
jgi:hypothetical protein